MKKLQAELREHGGFLLRVEDLGSGLSRYTLVSEKRTLLDFSVFQNGRRTSPPATPGK